MDAIQLEEKYGLPQRITKRIDFNGPVPLHKPELGPCWLWMGAKALKGYGHLRRKQMSGVVIGDTQLVHRLVYTAVKGPIPEGLTLDHLCENPPCCNPEHNESVTHEENIRRAMVPKGLWGTETHCRHGHEFTSENTRYRPDRGDRVCLTCDKAQQKASRTRNAQQRKEYNEKYYSQADIKAQRKEYMRQYYLDHLEKFGVVLHRNTGEG